MDWQPVKDIPNNHSIRAIAVHEKMFNGLKDRFPSLEEIEEHGATYLVEETERGRKYRYVKSEPLPEI